MASLLADGLAGLLNPADAVFNYNKHNYRYDRDMRQKMEYEVIDMRLEQSNLWREDVRCMMHLTLTKCEAYLLVITLELSMCVTALCKGRVPPGAPAWLAACHTLSLTGAFMYLFMGLWFGLHAYVAAQALKVRILTHFVRLPIPQWQTIEAARTYQSSYEKMKPSQMFRVPFAMGPQEKLASGGAMGSCFPQAQSVPSAPQSSRHVTFGGDGFERQASGASDGSGLQRQQSGSSSAPSGFRRQTSLERTTTAVSFEGSASRAAAADDATVKASDPWGLERRGDDIPELAPDVNEKTERQRHVYQCRDAQNYYASYDAFCRICMNAGTMSFANFLCYYCLTYVLTENASPVAAWGGMLAYIAIAVVLLRLDMKLTGREFGISILFLVIPPAICAAVTFVNSKAQGDPGKIEWYMPLVPLLHGLWYAYYISKFKVRELEGGAVLPAAFGHVLYLDSFGWSKLHLPKGATRSRRTSPLVQPSFFQSFKTILLGGSTTQDLDVEAAGCAGSDQPAMRAQFARMPTRPEDTAPAPAYNRALDNVSNRSGTFSVSTHARDQDADEPIPDAGGIATGKPGLVPWQNFKWATIYFAILWFAACVSEVFNLVNGNKTHDFFHAHFKDLTHGRVVRAEVSQLQMSGKVDTQFVSLLTRPRGLSCDRDGQHFVTSGMNSNGQESLLQAQLGSSGLHFKPLPRCINEQDVMEDVTLHNCNDKECSALVLPRHGQNLVPCRVATGAEDQEQTSFTSLAQTSSMVLPLSLAWLDDRGAAPLGSSPFEDYSKDVHDHPEEVSTFAAIPCNSPSSENCIVVGTTARRIVQLVAKTRGASSGASWLPQRILSNDVGEVPGPGAFALVGDKHLGVLLQKQGIIRLLDLQNGGNHTADLTLPKDRLWASVCAGGGNIFALEHGDDPSLWRFASPASAPKV
jgi:hypothetical protein